GKADGAAYGRARLAGRGDGLPVAGRQMVLVADDLDLVARTELGDERHDGAVDLGPDAGVADVGVECVGEIDGGRAARQGDQPTARGEAEDLVLEKLELGVFEEVLGGGAGGEVLDGRAQPGKSLALPFELVQVPRRTLLIEGVRGDA